MSENDYKFERMIYRGFVAMVIAICAASVAVEVIKALSGSQP
jgi:hypothetical protein